MLRPIILILVALGMTCSASAQSDTPAGHVFTAWLTAFNSGDRAVYKTFLENHFPPEAKNVNGWMGFRAITGGFDLKQIESSTPTTFTALVEGRLDETFARVTLKLVAAQPEYIADLSVQRIPTPAADVPPPMPEQQLIAALRSKLEQETRAGLFSGVAVIAIDGKQVFQQAYGFADRERHIPNTTDTRFGIGSMNKMFTAVAVLQLVASGKIRLDSPFGAYLTDYPNKDLSRTVTIHQLLTHTGGTGDIFGPEFDKHSASLRTLQDYANLYGSRSAAFAPGSKWEYSNYGFILLGLVIERVSGQSYYTYVRDHVFLPAGMLSTEFQPDDVHPPDLAVGYRNPDGSGWQPGNTISYTSAGGGYSTIGDFLRFANALSSYKLLDRRHTELLTTGKVDTPDGTRYAYGFFDGTYRDVRCFGHNGGAPGLNGAFAICPGIGYVIVTLANMDPPAASHVLDWVEKRLP